MDDRERKELNAQGAAIDARMEQLGIAPSPMFYDRQGKPIGMGDWTALRQHIPNIVVESTYIKGARISTVWLGIDHGFGAGPPIIFETMVFDETTTDRVMGQEFHPSWDQLTRRYATEADALAGHQEVVAEVRGLLKDKAFPDHSPPH